MGGLKSFEDTCDTLLQRGPDRVNPFALTAIIPNMGASRVSIELGTKGPLSSQCTACAASTMAIGDGLDAIRLGRADVVFAGGSEAPITPVGIAGFSALRALSRRNDDPEHASRPFETDRDGFVMGEAGAMLVLEELGHATRRRREHLRRARRLRRLLGCAAPDGARPDGPEPGPRHADGVRRRRRLAGPDRLHQRHGTSTPLGDASETRVIKRALGEHTARKVAVSSTKGATGHPLGAAGAVEAIFSTLAIHEGVVPPTINYETPDPECDLDYVPNEAREADVGVAVSNSSGFGGHNASIVLRRFAG
jgi:3-oxoacyl-[acyl-carrier-protein] synthase II